MTVSAPVHAAVQSHPIDVAELLAHVESPGAGGVVLFLGRVRDHARGQSVVRLDYEAYESMAVAELAALGEQAIARLAAVRVALAHRVGTLSIGEIAVGIAVSAAHREAAFASSRWLIDELKQRVPIWKREWYADGSRWIAEHP